MSRLLAALLSLAWLATAVGQTPPKKENQVQQTTQGAMQQRDYAGEQAKVDKSAPKAKTTNNQKAAEVDAATAQATQQRDYAGEQASEVDAATGQAAQQRDYAGEQGKASPPASK